MRDNRRRCRVVEGCWIPSYCYLNIYVRDARRHYGDEVRDKGPSRLVKPFH